MSVGVTRRYNRRQLLSTVGKASLALLLFQGVGSRLSVGFAQASPEGTLAQLEQIIASEIAAYPGEVGFAVTDLQTGESFSINGDRPQVGACTINLFLLYSVVDDLEKGLYPTWEVDWIVRAAVGASDPRWAKELVVKTGGGSLAAGVMKINKLMQSIGMVNSLYDHAPEYFGLYSLSGEENYVSANDLNVALGKLYRGELFSPPYTAYAFEKLLAVRPRLNNILPALLPASRTSVAHKVGFINYAGYSVRNDAGIVFVEKGGQEIAYVVSFMSQRNANYWAAASFGAWLSRIVFDHFDARY